MTDTVTIIDNKTTEISKVVTQYELQGASADALQKTFSPLFEKAKEWREKAAAIKVQNIGQTKEMGDARKARLEIKAVRIEAEKAKTRLKADSLRYGNAVQGAYNMILLLTEPVEQYLLDQEEYGKRMLEKQQAVARDLRMCEAGKYLEFFPQSVDLGLIWDEEFAKLLQFAKMQYDAREAEQARIENERLEKIRIEAAEREAMRMDNERLRAEAAEVEAQWAKERAAVQKAEAEYNAKLAAERAESDRLRQEADAKDLAEKQRIADEQAAKDAAEKEALEAPDMEKIKMFYNAIQNLYLPKVTTKKGADIMRRVGWKLNEIMAILREQ